MLFKNNSIIIIYLLHVAKCSHSPVNTKPDNYGAFEMLLNKYELCKGPKAKNSAIASVLVEKRGNDYMGQHNMTFLEQTTLEEVRIVVYSLNNSRKTALWNYRVNKPCQHFAFGPVLSRYLNTNSKCQIKKGLYQFELNYSEQVKTFFGNSFFYGEYLFKTTATSAGGNIICTIMRPTFVKKT